MKRIILAVLLCAAAQAAFAQAPSTAQPIAKPFLATCEARPALEHLTTAYNSGNWSGFQKDARDLFDALRKAAAQPATTGATNTNPANASTAQSMTGNCTPKTALAARVGDALDYTTNHVVLVWIGSTPLGKTQVMRALVHWPEPEAYTADLPGVTGFTEVFLAASLDARAASVYSSVAEKDPFAEQLPEFIKAVFAPLSTTIAGIAGAARGPGREAVAEPSLAVTVARVVMPIRRASVHLQMKLKDIVSQSEFADSLQTLATTLLFDGVGRSDRARKQVEALARKLSIEAKANCGPSPAPPDENTTVLSRSSVCREALDRVLKQEFDNAMAAPPAPPEKDATLVATVDARFRAVAVDALSTSADFDLTFKNRPLTKFTLGAGGAVIAKASLNRVRAKVDDKSGNLVSDPLTRVMTLAFVNWSPRGYNETAAKISGAERVRIFFGAALTPDFGFVTGVNVLLTRGIGIVAGGGALFGKGADEEEIGKPPAAKEDPFKLAVSKTLFLGISYNYK